MTKKDFELIASILRYYKVRADRGIARERLTIRSITRDFMKELSTENPRFNLDKFERAVGYQVS